MLDIINKGINTIYGNLAEQRKKQQERETASKIANLQNEVASLKAESENQPEAENPTTNLIVAITTIAVVAIAGFFLFRKTKR